MEFTEIFELYKNGSIAKGSNVMVSGYDKVQKIHTVDNIDESSMMFTFTLFNSDEIFQSADITEFVSKPYVDSMKRVKNTDLNKETDRTITVIRPDSSDALHPERSTGFMPIINPISSSQGSSEFITIQPKVLDYLSKRLSNKRDKCPIVDECIKLLNQFQDNGNKNDIADTIIKLSQKLNDLL
jgi:hypothetical protein